LTRDYFPFIILLSGRFKQIIQQGEANMKSQKLFTAIFCVLVAAASNTALARHGADDGPNHEANEHAAGHEANEHAGGHEANEHANRGGSASNDRRGQHRGRDDHGRHRRGKDVPVAATPATP
jgi:Ni/Co efflux regulator RcnB